MYGLVFEIVEEWVVEQQGLDVWHAIKEKAHCHVKDNAFLRRSYYPDDELVNIVVAASEVLSIEVPMILEAFGHFVIRHHYANGYDELLRCQGTTLRQWLSNLNAMHDFVQKTFEDEDKFVAPIFWCEDCDDVPGSILLHYYSLRGLLLVPMVVGIVEELASFQFHVEVKMHQLALQDQDGALFTTWRITAIDEAQNWKLSPKSLECSETFISEDSTVTQDFSVNFENIKIPLKCPYSGRRIPPNALQTTTCPARKCSPPNSVDSQATPCPSSDTAQYMTDTGEPSSSTLCFEDREELGLSLKKLRDVFPFHVLVDREFTILQVGSSLPFVLNADVNNIRGKNISDILDITRPVLGSSWNWNALQKLADQHFFIVPKTSGSLHKKVSMADDVVKFKTSMIEISTNKIMFILCPDARNVEELQSMNLTLSDLPLHSCQRDTVFLGEYITQEVNKAHELDKLSKKLSNEKNLSNTLLYNMLPKTIADTLRSGETVEPKQYENVTLFFSDIEGFTSLCDQVEPLDVIIMLNQLYTVMDHLATYFNLYKVETIGDAYMCCSGVPEPDEHHAENIANFALAVVECVKQVKNPVDGSPIRLRVGIHTGQCMAGVVGTLTPHYCLFGDMVNTTARHESTGMAGRVQCSSVLYGRLQHFSPYEKEQYKFTPRGLINMKGKGDCYTYWLECGTEHNQYVGSNAINILSEEVKNLLAKKTWKTRRYFRRSGELRSETTSIMSGSTATTELSSASEDNVEKSCNVTNPRVSVANTVLTPGPDELGSDSQSSEKNLDGFDGIDCSFHDVDHTEQTYESSKGDMILLDKRWSELTLDKALTREGLVTRIHQMLVSILTRCLPDPVTVDDLDEDLYNFVDRISKLYRNENRFHNFSRACHLVLQVTYLAERTDLVSDRWNLFILAFAALIHGIQHLGISNDQLKEENHGIWDGGRSCQEKRALQCGLDIFADEFPSLHDEVIWGCPNFVVLVRKAVLATDIENTDKLLQRVRKAMINATTVLTPRQLALRRDVTLELIMAWCRM